MNRRVTPLWRLWDVLAWSTVIFPLVTGGIWIRSPHLKLELSQLTVPVLVLAVLARFLPAVPGERLAHLFALSSMRFMRGCWRRWEQALDRCPGRTLSLATLFFGSLWAFASLRRHWAMGSHALDLGIFTSAMWNLLHGFGYVSSVKHGINLFADHQSPIFWALAPLFAVWPRAESLLIAQAFGLALGGAGVWALARQYATPGRSWFVALVPLLYWAYLPVRDANAFDFHAEVALLPFFLFGIWGLQEVSVRRRLLGALFFALAFACKESAGAVAAGIGLAWLAGAGPGRSRRFTRVFAAPVVIILGVALFLFDTRVVPGWLGTHYAYNENFAQFGPDGVLSVVRAFFERPGVFFGQLWGLERLRFLFLTLAPLAFLPLMGPRALVAALPGYLMIFLSSGTHRVELIYHYAIEPAVGLFWALATIAGVASQASRRFTQRQLALWTVTLALAFFGRSDLYRIRVFQPTPHSDWVRLVALPLLDPEVSLSATGSITPHLTSRHWAHYLPELAMPGAVTVDCVLYDSALNNFPMNDEKTHQLLNETIPRLGYGVEFNCGTFRAWSRPGRRCFRSLPAC